MEFENALWEVMFSLLPKLIHVPPVDLCKLWDCLPDPASPESAGVAGMLFACAWLLVLIGSNKRFPRRYTQLASVLFWPTAFTTGFWQSLRAGFSIFAAVMLSLGAVVIVWVLSRLYRYSADTAVSDDAAARGGMINEFF